MGSDLAGDAGALRLDRPWDSWQEQPCGGLPPGCGGVGGGRVGAAVCGFPARRSSGCAPGSRQGRKLGSSTGSGIKGDSKTITLCPCFYFYSYLVITNNYDFNSESVYAVLKQILPVIGLERVKC